jgi:adenylosuccinate lyase
MVQAIALLNARLNELRGVLVELAQKYKYTLMMGRTHGMHAEPITFGLKMVVWVREIDRSLRRLQAAHDIINVGKISGTVGTYANIDPQIETYVCRKLGLNQSVAATQILQRDRHAEFVTTLAIIGSSLDKFATEIRNLQRSEIHEVQEAHSSGQLSSTMLHKHNPILCERVSGLARIMRGYTHTALENIVLWHERDFAHAPSERIIISESCILLDYMLHYFTHVMRHLHIYPENMRKNLDLTLGLTFSQRVVVALIEHGLDDETANRLVRRNAQIAWEQKVDFQYLILDDEDIATYLTRAKIMELFDYDYHLRNIDYIYQRAEL